MVTQFVIQRLALLLGLTYIINGVVAFLSYTEEDDPHEPCEYIRTADLLPEGWGPVLQMPRRPSR